MELWDHDDLVQNSDLVQMLSKAVSSSNFSVFFALPNEFKVDHWEPKAPQRVPKVISKWNPKWVSRLAGNGPKPRCSLCFHASGLPKGKPFWGQFGSHFWAILLRQAGILLFRCTLWPRRFLLGFKTGFRNWFFWF